MTVLNGVLFSEIEHHMQLYVSGAKDTTCGVVDAVKKRIRGTQWLFSVHCSTVLQLTSCRCIATSIDLETISRQLNAVRGGRMKPEPRALIYTRDTLLLRLVLSFFLKWVWRPPFDSSLQIPPLEV